MKVNDFNLIPTIAFGHTNLLAIHLRVIEIELMFAMRKTGKNYWLTHESPPVWISSEGNTEERQFTVSNPR